MSTTYRVEVKSIDGYTTHSTHESYRDAADQADMVHGRIVCGTGLTDEAAWKYAVAEQGFLGDYDDWTSLDDSDRAKYENGAGGIPTA